MAAPLRAVDDVEASLDDVVTIDDRYELVGRVGRGATGSVYRAYDNTLDRYVALKLLKPGEHGVGERESQTLAKVAHRNVVTIHDYGQSNGHRYLVLELLEGRDFQDWLTSARRQADGPSASEIIARFIEAGRGLAAAHAAGLVHRDFKPSNVILTDSGRVVVIDFGLSRRVESLADNIESPQQRFTEGTLAYLAPERLAGHDHGERSDQFSYCVALWEALSGTNPFTGADPLARYRNIRATRPRCDFECPRQVASALERGLSFDPGQRFATMDDLLARLEGFEQPNKSRGLRPVLSAIAIAATFVVGWGVAPEGPTTELVHSRLDPRADLGLSLLESARASVERGDHQAALEDILDAAELVSAGTEPGDDEYCMFGELVPELGASMESAGGHNQARMAYAVAKEYSRTCAALSNEELRARREGARAMVFMSE